MAEAPPSITTITNLLTLEEKWHDKVPSTLRIGLNRDENGKLYPITSRRIMKQIKNIIVTPYAYRDEQDCFVCIVGVDSNGQAERIYDLIKLHKPAPISSNIQEEYTARYFTTLQARYNSYRDYKISNLRLSYATKVAKMQSDEKIASVKSEMDLWIEEQTMMVMNRYFAVIMFPKPFVVIRYVGFDDQGNSFVRLQPMDIRSFVGAGYGGTLIPGEGTKRMEVANTWIKSKEKRLEYDRFTFSASTPARCLNLWNGSPLDNQLESIEIEDPLLWEQHIRNVVVGAEVVATKLIDHCAWIVQHPLERPNAGILLRGDQGSGKGYIVSPFKAIYGQHYRYQRSSQACGRFTMSLANCRVLVIDEAGDLSQEQIDLIKTYITSDDLTHEEKGLPLITVPNCMAVFVLSNGEHCKLIERSDRRIFAIDLKDTYCQNTPENRAYWDRLWAIPSVVIYKWLLARDIGSYDPKYIRR